VSEPPVKDYIISFPFGNFTDPTGDMSDQLVSLTPE